MPETPRTYDVKQYVYDRRGERNEQADSFDDLVTHHPRANQNIRIRDGEIAEAEDMRPGYRGGNRSYAFIGGEFQEIIDSESDRYRNLRQDQVLVSKDFILEDPEPAAGRTARQVDVPSPVAGYVNAVNRNAGFVEIMDQRGGDVIARVRHMSEITIDAGDNIEYGQALGTQNNLGLNLPAGRGVHVHLDMDTRYLQQYEDYIRDLSDGRLPVQAAFREGVLPRPAVDDGLARLGESSDRVRDVQTALAADGYRAANGGPIEPNGVYRPDIQGAVIAFQQDHGLLQTGDIDLATWQQATHINQRAHIGGAGNPQPEPGFLGNRMFEGLQAAPAEALAPGDPRFGLRPPSDPARTGREPQWDEHAGHTQIRERGGENAREPVLRPEHPEQGAPQHQPAAPGMRGPGGRPGAPERDGPDDPPDRHGPPQRNGALLLDNQAHENHAMFASLLHTVHERDKELGRQPDEISRQLAGGLVEKARERGLDTIGAAKFTPDGTKVGMTDTANLSAEWAKTAVGDVGQLAGQKLSQSSENVATINQQIGLEQSLKPTPPTQGVDGPEGSTPKGPRLV